MCVFHFKPELNKLQSKLQPSKEFSSCHHCKILASWPLPFISAFFGKYLCFRRFCLEHMYIYRYITTSSKHIISSSIVLIILSIFTFIYCRYTQKNKTTLEPGTYVEHFDLYNPGNTFLSFGLGMYISVYLNYINST